MVESRSLNTSFIFYYFLNLGNEDEEDEDGKKPCVGLCYYNKLKAIKDRQKGGSTNAEQGNGLTEEGEDGQEHVAEVVHTSILQAHLHYRTLTITLFFRR